MTTEPTDRDAHITTAVQLVAQMIARHELARTRSATELVLAVTRWSEIVKEQIWQACQAEQRPSQSGGLE